MKRILATLIGAMPLFAATSPRADDISHSVAVSCDADRNRFSILADVRAEWPNAGPFDASEVRKIERLERGEFVRECHWEGVDIRAEILSWEATIRMCAGAGGAIVRSIEINGSKLALANLELSSFESCFSDTPHPASVAVTSESDGAYLHVCYSRWSWEEGWRAGECSRTKIEAENENEA